MELLVALSEFTRPTGASLAEWGLVATIASGALGATYYFIRIYKETEGLGPLGTLIRDRVTGGLSDAKRIVVALAIAGLVAVMVVGLYHALVSRTSVEGCAAGAARIEAEKSEFEVNEALGLRVSVSEPVFLFCLLDNAGESAWVVYPKPGMLQPIAPSTAPRVLRGSDFGYKLDEKLHMDKPGMTTFRCFATAKQPASEIANLWGAHHWIANVKTDSFLLSVENKQKLVTSIREAGAQECVTAVRVVAKKDDHRSVAP